MLSCLFAGIVSNAVTLADTGNCNAVSHNLAHFHLPQQKGIVFLSLSAGHFIISQAASLANICSPICIFGARDNSPLFFSMNGQTHIKQASVVVVDILTISAYFALVGFLAYRAYATRSFSIHPIYISAAHRPTTMTGISCTRQRSQLT